MADLKRLFIGKPLKSAENDEHKLSRFAALALLSSDALSSIAYGTEQIVVVLVTLSAAAHTLLVVKTSAEMPVYWLVVRC